MKYTYRLTFKEIAQGVRSSTSSLICWVTTMIFRPLTPPRATLLTFRQQGRSPILGEQVKNINPQL